MNQRGEIITNIENIDSYSNLILIHKQLNKEIDQINIKIQQKIQRCQCQFLVAYQNHLKKIRYQLGDVRGKFQYHQREVINNKKLLELQKNVMKMRNQSAAIYCKLQEKTQESQMYKSKSKQLQKKIITLQKQIKQYLKRTKIAQTKLLATQLKVSQLQQQLKQKTQQQLNNTKTIIPPLQHHSKNHQLLQQKTKSITTDNSNLKLFKERQYRQLTPNKTSRNNILEKVRRKSMNCSGGFYQNKDDLQLKDWFFQCIRSIKKQVALRKNVKQFNFDYITSIDKFKMVDKLRVLQKFMENQKLLTWMYQKIFPSRTHQLIQYFSQKNKSRLLQKNHLINSKNGNVRQNQEIYNGEQIKIDKMDQSDGGNFKLMELKNRRNQLKNKAQMKEVREGKLNLTYL